LRTIWRSERGSATTFGHLGGERRADDDPLAVRLRLHQRHALLDDRVHRHRLERQLEFARLDLRQVEKVVDQAHQMRAGDVDVAQIAAVAVVADRPEALLHHYFREAMTLSARFHG
jgi:hypothetical protein